MRDYIRDVFETLDEKEVNYAVLRGYMPLEEMQTSSDIDVYVYPKDLAKTKGVLEGLGFKTPRINACNYPHVQYFLLTAEKLLKIDIVTELCFGESLLTYVPEDTLLQHIEKREFIKTFRSDIALELFVLHVVYDKGALSTQNALRLQCFLEECNYGIHPAIKEFCDLFLEGSDVETLNQMILRMREVLKCDEDLLREKSNLAQLKRRTDRNVKWRYRFHRFPRKSIALLGVDGSGKSTTVKALQNLLGTKCCVQYMGFREMETSWGKEYYASGKRFKFKLLPFIGIYLEMWYRYLKNRFNNYKIIFYDRFPWEAYDNGFGKYKVLYFVLFKLLFPRPKKVYYLYCSVQTSLARKDDILNETLFINMKERFDKKYKDKKSICSFDTDKLTTGEILDKICEDIMESGFYEYLF